MTRRWVRVPGYFLMRLRAYVYFNSGIQCTNNHKFKEKSRNPGTYHLSPGNHRPLVFRLAAKIPEQSRNIPAFTATHQKIVKVQPRHRMKHNITLTQPTNLPFVYSTAYCTIIQITQRSLFKELKCLKILKKKCAN